MSRHCNYAQVAKSDWRVTRSPRTMCKGMCLQDSSERSLGPTPSRLVERSPTTETRKLTCVQTLRRPDAHILTNASLCQKVRERTERKEIPLQVARRAKEIED
jgi:hypothetical protein